MSENVKCRCGASGGNYLCKDCLTVLTRWVSDLVGMRRPGHPPMDLMAELQVTAARQDRLFGTGPALYSTKRGSQELPPAPPEALPPFLRSQHGQIALPATRWQFGWDAALLLAQGRTTIFGLAKHLAERRGTELILPLNAWFAGNLAFLATDPAAPEWYEDIRWLREAVEYAIDRREPDLFAGRCTQPDESSPAGGAFLGRCGADLYYRTEDVEVRCKRCGAIYGVADMKAALLASVDDQIDTTTVIANALTGLLQPVTPAMIRQMAHRGQIADRGTSPDGRSKVYRVGDIVSVLQARREREHRKLARA